MKKLTLFLFSLLILASCTSNSSNRLESFEIENKEKRIEVLSEQIKEYSEILDAEYSLFNANGFENRVVFVSAASYWDYKIALQIDANNLDKWLIGMYNAENENAEDSVWIKTILDNLDTTRKQNWIENMEKSNPKRFTISATNGYTKVAIVYQNDTIDEAVIFERIIQQ
ncbi:hypothetical protein ACE193_06910 [Bernardetia sp. OM2101]|uniref:hypothetical protein n=1 Tax=Bernardetia sp. OM2101 TaxID=3344876 RepID=UPI0035CFA933